MNFITGRQCFNLGQLEDSQNALRKLLIYESHQPPLLQASHLREFLAVFKVIKNRVNLTSDKRNDLLHIVCHDKSLMIISGFVKTGHLIIL